MKKLYEQYLEERKVTTQLRISRDSKIARDIGARSVSTAKKQNDVLYKRMKFHMEMYKKFKRQLIKKYSSRVRQKARS